jgi:hypothetical protein
MVGLLMVAGALVSGVTSAAASGPGPLEPGRYRTAYESASASSLAPSANGPYLGTTISVFRTEVGTQACIDSVDTAVDGGLFIESGCASIADSAFVLDKKLASTSLAPTSITVSQTHCTPGNVKESTCTVLGTRSVEVAATFEGVGEVQTTKGRSSYSDGTYQFKGSGSFRAANGSLTTNGETQSGVGSLTTSKNLTVVRAN